MVDSKSRTAFRFRSPDVSKKHLLFLFHFLTVLQLYRFSCMHEKNAIMLQVHGNANYLQYLIKRIYIRLDLPRIWTVQASALTDGLCWNPRHKDPAVYPEDTLLNHRMLGMYLSSYEHTAYSQLTVKPLISFVSSDEKFLSFLFYKGQSVCTKVLNCMNFSARKLI